LIHILQKIARSEPCLGPLFLSKIDISDGFYRIAIFSEGVPKLAVVFPTEPGEEQLIGLPLVLPMGWTQSPPMFTAATQTVADLANIKLRSRQVSLPHRLDAISETPIVPEPHPLITSAGPESLPLPFAPRFQISWDV
jgi:hypothetical protein